MITGMGVDIVEVYRMRDAVSRWGDSFLNKIFTPREIKYARSRRFSCQHFAARFAAKEAVVKAFGQPRKFPIKWTDVEILNDKEGKPVAEFHNDALKLKKIKKVSGIMISMSHSKNYAVANAVLVKKI